MSMTSFTAKNQSDNIAGVQFVMFVETSTVERFPVIKDNSVPFTGIRLTDVDVVDPWNYYVPWKGIGFTRESCEFREEQVRTENGYVFKQIVEMNIAKHTYARLINMDAMEHSQFLVIVHMNNGEYRLCGFLNERLEEFGMRFKDLGKTGKSERDYGGYGCSFTLDSPRRSLKITPSADYDDPDWPDDPDYKNMTGVEADLIDNVYERS